MAADYGKKGMRELLKESTKRECKICNHGEEYHVMIQGDAPMSEPLSMHCRLCDNRLCEFEV